MSRFRLTTVLGICFVSAVLTPACSDDEDTGAGAFGADYCRLLMPCCEAAGFGSDPASCEQLVSVLAMSDGFDESKADACLDGMRAVPSDDDYCRDVMAVDACDAVFAGPGGSVQPGGSCEMSSDCAHSGEGQGTCVSGPDDGDVCMIVATGGEGSSPCVGTKRGVVAVVMPPSPPPEVGYVCDEAKGVFCDFASRACTAKKQVGEACDHDTPCVDGARCDSASGTCAARAAVGEACDTSFYDWCVEEAYCDDGTCAERLPDGSPCTSDECKGSCVDDVCEPSYDIGYAMICGG